MAATLIVLIAAAGLEIGGDAAIRRGLIGSQSRWLVLGAAVLVAYGFVVNVNRSIEFGRLMGLYIAVFFIVSQISSYVFFGERPSISLMVGGALIAAGGMIIQWGAR